MRLSLQRERHQACLQRWWRRRGRWGGDSGGSEAPTGTLTLIGPTQSTSPLTSGPSLKRQIDQMSEADLRAHPAKWGRHRAPSFTDLDYLYAWCRLGGLSSGTCLEYASLKDWGDLDRPTGTLAGRRRQPLPLG